MARADLQGLPDLPGRSHLPGLLGLLGLLRRLRLTDQPGLSGLQRLSAHQHLPGQQVLSGLALHPHPAYLEDPSIRVGLRGQQDRRGQQAPFHPIRLDQEDRSRLFARPDRLGQEDRQVRPDQQRRWAAKQP